ncbi:hypothetical protein COT51_03825 [candidate division WWE3 bacterium CG08_land_8_20_14_0_20_41_15]|uniref:Uncharacterized protein n=1 Tax=candidate division WWE3 bacterium CG08_land_8_20_14_0_20_41_15 TaxID=1975086 RepID=A0A2H0X8K3_UNCKA|nr:MAG: hypothetical protein COT51_03825 [candidate division WWE3 bacterium CG08_land_8_20_14_0_20_41_15]
MLVYIKQTESNKIKKEKAMKKLLIFVALLAVLLAIVPMGVAGEGQGLMKLHLWGRADFLNNGVVVTAWLTSRNGLKLSLPLLVGVGEVIGQISGCPPPGSECFGYMYSIDLFPVFSSGDTGIAVEIRQGDGVFGRVTWDGDEVDCRVDLHWPATLTAVDGSTRTVRVWTRQAWTYSWLGFVDPANSLRVHPAYPQNMTTELLFEIPQGRASRAILTLQVLQAPAHPIEVGVNGELWQKVNSGTRSVSFDVTEVVRGKREVVFNLTARGTSVGVQFYGLARTGKEPRLTIENLQ